MSSQPSILATLATKDAIKDLNLFLSSLQLWSASASAAVMPTIYIFGDDAVVDFVRKSPFAPYVHVKSALTPYTSYTRKEMEQIPGVHSDTLWQDFMMEKIALLEWVFQVEGDTNTKGVLFCDADIFFLGPLPFIPNWATVALSSHRIRLQDEAKFGRYNGGFLWIRDLVYLEVWREACKTSRFYEQAALENVAESATLQNGFYEFPITQNYGWWRLFQGETDAATLKKAWTMHNEKAPNSSGILLSGEPLGSIHTHWYEQRDLATVIYNAWVYDLLRRLGPIHPPAKTLLAMLPVCRSPVAVPRRR